LVYLGWQSLREALRLRREATVEFASTPTLRKPLWRSYLQGFLTNVLNPKVAAFYLAILPQFMRPGDPVWRNPSCWSASTTPWAGVAVAAGAVGEPSRALHHATRVRAGWKPAPAQ